MEVKFNKLKCLVSVCAFVSAYEMCVKHLLQALENSGGIASDKHRDIKSF